MDNVVLRKAVIATDRGLDSRPAALLAAAAGQFRADVLVKFGGEMVNGKSLLGLMSLGAPRGAVVTIIAEGSDAKDAVSRIELLLQAAVSD